VQLQLSADQKLSAEAAARRVRLDCAARRLHVLRLALAAQEQAARFKPIAAHGVRRAERRAQAALARARFADPLVSSAVLRQVQVLTLTRTLAQLDYTTADHAQAVLASLIAVGPGNAPATGGLTSRALRDCRRCPVIGNVTTNGYPAASGFNGASAVRPAWTALNGLAGRAAPGTGHPAPPAARQRPHRQRPGDRDSSLIDAAVRVVAQARTAGGHLSQAALARQLRAQGYSIANDRLRWLATASRLDNHADRT